MNLIQAYVTKPDQWNANIWHLCQDWIAPTNRKESEVITECTLSQPWRINSRWCQELISNILQLTSFQNETIFNAKEPLMVYHCSLVEFRPPTAGICCNFRPSSNAANKDAPMFGINRPNRLLTGYLQTWFVRCQIKTSRWHNIAPHRSILFQSILWVRSPGCCRDVLNGIFAHPAWLWTGIWHSYHEELMSNFK